MKRNLFLALTCAALVCIMMLSSCASLGSVAFKKMFDAEQYTKDDSAYAKAEVVVGLAEMVPYYTENQLVLFSREMQVNGVTATKYAVYNIETNSLVYEATTSNTTALDVKLSAVGDSAFFTVTSRSWRLDSNNVKVGRDYINTALYDAKGTKLAETYRTVQATTEWDLVRFDGKCYRVDADNNIAYAFDYSDLNQLPSIIAASDKYYFAANTASGSAYDNAVSVYTKELEFKTSMELPSFADVNALFSLGNNKFLVQYTVEEDENAKKYDYIAEKTVTITADDGSEYTVDKLQKYSITTGIWNLKNDKFKNVNLDYFIRFCETRDETIFDDDWYGYGMAKDCTNVAILCPIEDQRINNSEGAITIGTFNSKGQLKALESMTGANISEFPYLVADNRWLIGDAEGREFIVDEKGKAVGEVTNAYFRDTYLYSSGKMYNYDLEIVYDYAKDNLAIEYALDECVLFRNIDNEIICYSSTGSNIIIKKDSKRGIFAVENDYFIIKDTTATDKVTYEFYNAKGDMITTINTTYDVSALTAQEMINEVCNDGNYTLFKIIIGVDTSGNFKYEYYRFGA